MPVVWAAISAHGYGHAAQVVPVLNALGERVSHLTVVLRTIVPASFFQDRLTIPWTLQPVQQDAGCVQQGPLTIDVAATWNAHARFHTGWNERLTQEVAAMRSSRPRVIIADTPYLACTAGAQAGIATIGLANFTWAEILERYLDPREPSHRALVAAIEEAYGRADAALRIAPGLALSSYKTVADIDPIAQPASSQRDSLRAHIGASPAERLVLVGFGGIPLTSLPWERMQDMNGYQFLVDGTICPSYSRIHHLSTLPYSFKTLLASVDVVMTKPGYGTVVEAVTLGIPIVYVRRHHFADEQPLVNFMDRHGHTCELSLEDFVAGQWETALHAAQTTPIPVPPPACTGASDAARYLEQYF